jgi:NADPH:quinone reductase-like Zn-dependent oxidoreductase
MKEQLTEKSAVPASMIIWKGLVIVAQQAVHRLADEFILVTAAASGTGAATTMRLASEGNKVAIVAIADPRKLMQPLARTTYRPSPQVDAKVIFP